MKTRSRPKRLKKREPAVWDLWEARGATLPPDEVLYALSRGEQAESHEQPERQLELFPVGGRLVPVEVDPPSVGSSGGGASVSDRHGTSSAL